MANKIIIGGISLELKFCKKMKNDDEDTPITLDYVSSEPIVNIYKGADPHPYIVNIMSYIPPNLNDIPEKDLNSGLFLSEDNTIFLSYTGVNMINTPITTTENLGKILCRVFNILYDCEDQTPSTYDLYHIQFEYSLLAKNFQSVEGIIVHDINLDPETDRGTVTTVRIDDQ